MADQSHAVHNAVLVKHVEESMPRKKRLSFVVPFVTAYEMRAGFGGRTGGSTDANDLANINISFSP